MEDAENGSRRTGAWTEEEDALLCSLVEELGTKSWTAVAERMNGTRSGKSCRLRWHNQLNPAVNKTPFTDWEQAVIVQAQGMESYVNRWAAISRLLQGRTDNAVKNHWHATLSRKARAGTLANRYLERGASLEWLLANPNLRDPREVAASSGSKRVMSALRGTISGRAGKRSRSRRSAAATAAAGAGAAAAAEAAPAAMRRGSSSGSSGELPGSTAAAAAAAAAAALPAAAAPGLAGGESSDDLACSKTGWLPPPAAAAPPRGLPAAASGQLPCLAEARATNAFCPAAGPLQPPQPPLAPSIPGVPCLEASPAQRDPHRMHEVFLGTHPAQAADTASPAFAAAAACAAVPRGGGGGGGGGAARPVPHLSCTWSGSFDSGATVADFGPGPSDGLVSCGRRTSTPNLAFGAFEVGQARPAAPAPRLAPSGPHEQPHGYSHSSSASPLIDRQGSLCPSVQQQQHHQWATDPRLAAQEELLRQKLVGNSDLREKLQDRLRLLQGLLHSRQRREQQLHELVQQQRAQQLHQQQLIQQHQQLTHIQRQLQQHQLEQEPLLCSVPGACTPSAAHWLPVEDPLCVPMLPEASSFSLQQPQQQPQQACWGAHPAPLHAAAAPAPAQHLLAPPTADERLCAAAGRTATPAAAPPPPLPLPLSGTCAMATTPSPLLHHQLHDDILMPPLDLDMDLMLDADLI